MSFTPVVPAGGLVGFRFLERTYDAQFAAFNRSPDIEREVSYFLANAGQATTAADLVADRRLLRVALGAFGLDEEVDKRAFVRRVLEEGTLDPKALANRLADPAWRELAAYLGYGDLGGRLVFAEVRQEIAARFRERQFERALGEVDVDMRLAFNFRRRIAEIAQSANVERSGWLRILGSKPLRRVLEQAYGLPDSFARIDIERQREVMEERTARLFGSPSPAVFGKPEAVETVLRRFLTRSALENGPGPLTRGAAAVTLLTTSGLGSGAQANLVLSAITGTGGG